MEKRRCQAIQHGRWECVERCYNKRVKKYEENFKKIVGGFYQKNKRDFPWRSTKNAYHILISEVMLQQTQASRVLQKYPLFLKAFPTLELLSTASNTAVLSVWQGMGYNRRALYLKQITQEIVKRYKGKIPSDPLLLKQLPGIGHATACSIVVFAYNLPYPFIETNIRRVFIHHFFKNKTQVKDSDMLPLVTQTMDEKNPREWFYALMDYGANLVGKVENPNRQSAHYHQQSKFEGSNRQLRGKILKLFLSHTTLSIEDIKRMLDTKEQTLQTLLTDLQKEGFIQKRKRFFFLKHENAQAV